MQQNVNTLTRLSALALGIAGALALGQAQAAGFQLKENSVKAMGRAFAGSAAVGGDTSVVVNNPAAMSLFEQRAVQTDVTAVDISFNFNGGGGGVDAFGRPLLGGDGGDAGDITPIPALSMVLPLSGDFEYVTLGAMVSAPFGLKTEYEPTWVGRYSAIKSEVEIIDLTLSAAVDVTDHFSIGAGVIFERAEVTLSNAIDFGSAVCRPSAATGGLPPPFCLPLGGNTFGPQQNDGAASINGTDNNVGWLIGAHFHPNDKLNIGVSYRAEIDHEISGDADFTVPANVVPILAVGAPGQFVDTQGAAALTTPSITTVSVSYAFTDRFTMMADYARTGWSSLRNVTVDFENPSQADSVEPFNWSDSDFYSIGAEFALNEQWVLRAGLARDDTPTNDEARTPRLPDQNRNWVSLGVTWNMSEAFEITGGFTHIMVDDPSINAVLSSSGSRLTGSFSADANLYGISAQYKF